MKKMTVKDIGDLAQSLAPDPIDVGEGEWHDLGSGVRLYPVNFRGRRVFVTIPED